MGRQMFEKYKLNNNKALQWSQSESLVILGTSALDMETPRGWSVRFLLFGPSTVGTMPRPYTK